MRAICKICDSDSFYDPETLAASTYVVNGLRTVLCSNCYDDLWTLLAQDHRVTP